MSIVLQSSTAYLCSLPHPLLLLLLLPKSPPGPSPHLPNPESQFLKVPILRFEFTLQPIVALSSSSTHNIFYLKITKTYPNLVHPSNPANSNSPIHPFTYSPSQIPIPILLKLVSVSKHFKYKYINPLPLPSVSFLFFLFIVSPTKQKKHKKDKQRPNGRDVLSPLFGG